MYKFICLHVLLVFAVASAQVEVNDLCDEIEKGHITAEEIKGTGYSSGAAVVGTLLNNIDVELNIDIILQPPMFMRNQGNGQDMIAMKVFYGDGAFYSIGVKSFITLKPHEKKEVVYIAYCADFEKDNPSRSDSFKMAAVPDSLSFVLERIAEYERQHPLSDITGAAQAAIWMAQGISINRILEKFEISSADQKLARQFIQKQ